jgi:hypothetical protein
VKENLKSTCFQNRKIWNQHVFKTGTKHRCTIWCHNISHYL